MDIAGIWNHQKYNHVYGSGNPILADGEYELQIVRTGGRNLSLRLKDTGGNVKAVAAIDSGSHLCVFSWDDAAYTYSGTAFATRFDSSDVLVGVVERKPKPPKPDGLYEGGGDSDMGTFTATKPIGDPPYGKS